MTDVKPASTAIDEAPFLLHDVRVVGRRRISGGFVRVTFGGETLDRFADPGLDQRIKLLLPAADGTLDAMPRRGDWYAAWRALPDARRPVIRTYTTRAVRSADRQVDVDFVVHEPCGPAGRFAAECAPGDPALLLGPNAGARFPAGGIDFRLPSSATRVLVAGDETALPAIARILQALPAGVCGAVVVEVPHEDDVDQLRAPAGVELVALVRGDGAVGGLLPAAVREAAASLVAVRPAEEPEDVDIDRDPLWEVPDAGTDGPFYAWLAGEAAVIKGLRRMLVAELGVDRRSVAFMGYWRAGRSETD